MKCPIETGQAAEILLAYSSGEMDVEASAAFADHIRGCAACREQAEAQLAVWQVLDEWEAPPVTPDFDQRLYARIATEVSWWDRLWRPVFLRRAMPVAAAAAAVVAAVLMVRPPVASEPAVPRPAVVEAVSPDQAEQTLQDMETMREFSRIMRTEAAEPQM